MVSIVRILNTLAPLESSQPCMIGPQQTARLLLPDCHQRDSYFPFRVSVTFRNFQSSAIVHTPAGGISKLVTFHVDLWRRRLTRSECQRPSSYHHVMEARAAALSLDRDAQNGDT